MKKTSREEFLTLFRKLSTAHAPWEVWDDFISMSAAAIANAVDKRPEVWKKREDEYLRTVKKYTREEHSDICALLALTVLIFEENPWQDFLGEQFMTLGLSDHRKGQFFTPYHVAELMAQMTGGIDIKIKAQVDERGYASVYDNSCGAGCMLIAFADACHNVFDVNYQQNILFVGQDIDPLAAKMAYIQLSLLGCPGYVVIGNSLTEPVGGSALSPVFERAHDIWYTPFYFTEVWEMRRMTEVFALLLEPKTVNDAIKLPRTSNDAAKPPKTEDIPQKKPFSLKGFLTPHKKHGL